MRIGYTQPPAPAKPREYVIPETVQDVVWSHSQLEQAEQCLLRYKRNKVDKAYPYVQGEAAKRGDKIHNAIEHWLKGDKAWTRAQGLSDKDAAQLAKFMPILNAFDNAAQMADWVEHEQDIAIDRHDNVVGYYSKAVQARFKLDFAAFYKGGAEGYIVDWKTGKVWDTRPQAERYGWLAFRRWPALQRVRIQFAYIDKLTAMPAYDFTRADIPRLSARSIATLSKIVEAHRTGVWPTKPSGLCRFCEVAECSENTNPKL